MPSKIFYSARVDTQTIVDASASVSAGTASILGAMKALSESHRVLEHLIIRGYEKSQTLPLSSDQKLSILFLLFFLAYCFIVYPLLCCPTANVAGSYWTSTGIGYLPHFYHKHHHNADQWALNLHRKHGPVVRLTPTLVSVNDTSLLPNIRKPEPGLASSSRSSASSSPEKSATARASAASADKQSPEAQDLTSTISAVMNDLRSAMKGQKTVDIHSLLQRHLGSQTPTTFTTFLSHTIYQLAHPLHRHYFNRLVKELHCLHPATATSNDQIHTLQLLGAVVKESLRLQQAPASDVPIFTVTGKGCKLSDYWLPQGIEVAVSGYCLCRNSLIFSAPADFRPDRWLENTDVATKAASTRRQQMRDALDFALGHQRGLYSASDALHFKVLLFTIIWGLDMKLPLGEQPVQISDEEVVGGRCRIRFRERKKVVEKRVRFAEHVFM